MSEYMNNSHTLSRLNAHIVWITKYCYHVLHGDIQKRFWGVGYGMWSTGNITEEMIQEYLEHYRDMPNFPNSNWILES